jgi:hypothetical protein
MTKIISISIPNKNATPVTIGIELGNKKEILTSIKLKNHISHYIYEKSKNKYSYKLLHIHQLQSTHIALYIINDLY